MRASSDSRAEPTIETGTSGVAAPAAERVAARANRAARTSLAANGRGTDGPAGRQERGFDSEDGVADQPALSARRPGACLVRATQTGESGLVGCTAPATHRSLGLWSSAGRPLALDRAPTNRRSGKAQAGSARVRAWDARPSASCWKATT